MDLNPIWLTIRLALTTTLILLLLSTPLAWWLSQTRSRFRAPIEALIALPLILPPTVLGFYLLVLMGPDGPIGKLTTSLGLGLFPFTFTGLVIGSIIYSLPFTVQPLLNSFEAIKDTSIEVAATLGASPVDRFFSVALPLAKSGFISASILGFAHTVGEFGIVLMLGGNIPQKTKVISIAIYDHVEAIEYSQAHTLSAGMLVFSFISLFLLYVVNQRSKIKSRSGL